MGGCRCTFRTCCVSSLKFPNMSFFHYPVTKQEERLNKWIQYANYAIIRTMPISQGKNRAVCGLHFRDECFMNYKKNRLAPGAVPTLDRLKTGQVLDYTLGDNPKPTTLPPTKEGHLIPPAGVLVWGQPPEYWNSYTTITSQYAAKPKSKFSNDSTPEPPAKKPKLIEITEVPRVLNKDVRFISMDEDFEIDETTATVSLSDEVFSPEDEVVDDPSVVVDTSSIDLPEARTCLVANRSLCSEVSDVAVSPGNIININDVEFLTVDPMEAIEESVSRSTLDATCSSYEGEIALLKKDLENQEKKAEQEIADLRAQLGFTKEKLQLAGNIASAWKSKLAECEKKAAELETRNQELLGKSSEQLSVSSKSPAVSASLSKAQLFNGIKKYMGASMMALVRMEMFGSSERAWKPDEKQVSVELLKLGEDIYNYFRDEWRFRLPPKKMVEQWANEVTDGDADDDDL